MRGDYRRPVRDTPYLAVDVDLLDRNLAAMADAARAHGVLDAADRLADLVVRAATGGTP